jgi:hypothetical protein
MAALDSPRFIMVHTVASSEKINRRTFLFAGFAVAVGATRVDGTRTGRLETLTQWLNASHRTRKLALQPCVDRIREMDRSIHAWVQVLPQRPTGDGKLAEIPFAAKDIMETRGLLTEYGSPIYKGRIGTSDAAIVRDLRQREQSCSERHSTRPSHIARPPQRAIHVIWSIRRGEAPAGRQRLSRLGWCHSLWEPRPGGRYCDPLPFAV